MSGIRPAVPVENTPVLETERLILRRFTSEDAKSLWEILRDPEVNTFLPWFPVETLGEAEIFLKERFLDTYQSPEGYRYAVVLKEHMALIGYIQVSGGEEHDLGYGIRKEFWHQGIMSEAAGAVAERLKQDGFPYITATHDIQNPHSGDVMKKIGMTYRYSFQELWQPKNKWVTFRMYQLNWKEDQEWTYWGYWGQRPRAFIEKELLKK